MRIRTLAIFVLGSPLALSCGQVFASSGLADLSIEELMQQQVTSVSKKEQKLSDTAAAIYVITQDDIERSGATNIPDVLSLAPGVEVAQINSHNYSITIRGFSGQWGNKLLVLVDGRPVYTETYGGVYWDMQDLMLEDIERIEVIRGPGASVWGANAVNGVINIISKSARDTQDGLASVTVGKEEKGLVSARYGFAAGEHGDLRLYAKGQKLDDAELLNGKDAQDDFKSMRAGLRGDWDLPKGDRLTVIGDVYRSSFDITPFDPTAIVTPVGALSGDSGKGRGYNLLTRWTHTLSLTSETTLQAYYDQSERSEYIDITEKHLDVDFQHQFRPAEDHDLIWGASIRYREDDFSPVQALNIDPLSTSNMLYSLFVQDEIKLAKDEYRLTLGSKFEHNEYSGWEIQPTARLLWNLDPRHKLWAAVSRSVRTPARTDRDLSFDLLTQVPFPPFMARFQVLSDKNFQPEKVMTYEIGYRTWPMENLSVDATAFVSDYEDVRAYTAGSINPFSQPYPTVTSQILNGVHGQVYGVELSTAWDVSKHWRLQGVASHQDMNLSAEAGAEESARVAMGNSPKNQLALRSSLELNRAWSWDLQLKYVSQLDYPSYASILPGGKIDSYVDLDTRLGWRVNKNLQLSLVGKNLLDKARLEYSSESGLPITLRERSYYLKALVSF